jgi:hypothetical protein
MDRCGCLRIRAIAAVVDRPRGREWSNIPRRNASSPSAWDWANAGTGPAATNPASASATGRYFLAVISLFTSHLLLIIDPHLGPMRIAASGRATHQHFDRARGLLREVRHDLVRSVAESVALLCRVALDEAIEPGFVALSTLAS